jgi:hypothetical protein
VTRALIAEIDFEAVGEEGEEVGCDCISLLPTESVMNLDRASLNLCKARVHRDDFDVLRKSSLKIQT